MSSAKPKLPAEPQLKACDAAELASRDAALNKIYKQLLNALPPTRQSQLRSAERMWVGFRDAECAFQMSAEAGGSDASLVESNCRLTLTSQRIEQLQQAAKVAKF